MLAADRKTPLRVAIAWSGILKADDEAAARFAAQLFRDPKVAQFYDPHRRAGEWVARHSGLHSLAEIGVRLAMTPSDLCKTFQPEYVHGPAAQFDTVCLIPPGIELQQYRLVSDNWVSQLDPQMFTGYDASRFKFAREFALELSRLIELQVRRASVGTSERF